VLFSLLYIGLCRIFALIPCTRRSKWDKDIKIMVLQHQVRILERPLHACVRYRPADWAILAALSRLPFNTATAEEHHMLLLLRQPLRLQPKAEIVERGS
jgi:hypothetical protein